MRFLLLAANFAPRSGSHPTRTVHLTKYLHRFGHEVKVVTYREDQHTLYAVRDDSLAAKVPEDVEVHRVAPGWVHRLAAMRKKQGHAVGTDRTRASRSLLASLLIPDPHTGAGRAFKNAATSIAEEWKPDVLVTFAYPFTLTLVGSALKKRYPGLKWIADYGDPWNGAPVRELSEPSWRRHLDRRLESRALSCADAVTVTTEPTAALYRRQFPDLDGRVHVLTMGYDPDDSARIAARPRPAAEENDFVLLHAGRLYSEARDPEPFLRAVERCQAADEASCSRLRIVLLGEVEPALVEAIERSPVRDRFELHGWVTVEESLARMKAADALLLFGNQGAMQIPGKVFQYFGTGRPVFMTCETPDDPTVQVVERYGNGMIVENRAEALAGALSELLAGRTSRLSGGGGHEEFGWPVIAERLVRIAEGAGAGRRT